MTLMDKLIREVKAEIKITFNGGHLETNTLDLLSHSFLNYEVSLTTIRFSIFKYALWHVIMKGVVAKRSYRQAGNLRVGT